MNWTQLTLFDTIEVPTTDEETPWAGTTMNTQMKIQRYLTLGVFSALNAHKKLAMKNATNVMKRRMNNGSPY